MTNTGTPALPTPVDLAPVLGGPLGAHWYPAPDALVAHALVPLVWAAEARAMHTPLPQHNPARGGWGVFVSLAP